MAVDVLQATTFTVAYSVIASIAGGGIGIRSVGGSTATLNRNIVFNFGTLYTGVSAGANDVNTNPLFKNTATHQYELSGVSPAIDAATGSTTTSDVTGKSRAGTTPDLGAYEF